MVSKELVVKNDSGIHARPAALIVETASRFPCDVTFVKDGMRANAKSIMNIMLLAAEPGSVIRVETAGQDEEAALAAIEHLFESRFKYE